MEACWGDRFERGLLVYPGGGSIDRSRCCPVVCSSVLAVVVLFRSAMHVVLLWARTNFDMHAQNLHARLQGTYPPLLDYYSDDLKALARGMINTNPNDRPDAEQVLDNNLSRSDFCFQGMGCT